MIQFKKGRKSLYLYLAAIILTIGVLVTWLVLVIKSPQKIVGDIILLSILFSVLLGGEVALLSLYLRRPMIPLEVDDTSVYIHLSKKKVKTVPIRELSTINLSRSLLYVVTTTSVLYTVRFLADPKEAQNVLKAKLHDFIRDNPDAYFTGPPKS